MCSSHSKSKRMHSMHDSYFPFYMPIVPPQHDGCQFIFVQSGVAEWMAFLGPPTGPHRSKKAKEFSMNWYSFCTVPGFVSGDLSLIPQYFDVGVVWSKSIPLVKIYYHGGSSDIFNGIFFSHCMRMNAYLLVVMLLHEDIAHALTTSHMFGFHTILSIRSAHSE